MINFDEFDIEESPIKYKIVNFIYKHKYKDIYSYYGYRYCLYNQNNLIYLGNGKWKQDRVMVGISKHEKQLITDDRLLITTPYMPISNMFRSWVLSGLVYELEEYSPEFIEYVDKHQTLSFYI